MAFTEEIKLAVDEYARKHIANEEWHLSYFDFIDDKKLALRIGEELLAARYIYKLLEGLSANEWLQRAQIRLQVLAYASIYEASIHHLLFSNNSENQKVIELTEFPTNKLISIPTAKMDLLKIHLEHDGKKIITTYEGVGKTDQTKVRFDRKAECACELEIIEPWLKDELIEFYEARNSIHIHAEIRKGLEYELDLSRRAYWRMQPFKEQVSKWLRGREV